MFDELTERLETYTIYCIRNKNNNKRYIGRTKNVKTRLSSHYYAIKSGKHKCIPANEGSINDYEFLILEDHVEGSKRTEKEKYYMQLYSTNDPRYGYNVKDLFFKSNGKRGKDMFAEYLRRQLSHRGNVYEKLGISKATFYKHLNNPNDITVRELKLMVLVGEIDENKLIDFIYGREKL